MTRARALLAIWMLGGWTVPTLAEDVRVKLDDQQRATVVGSGPSVREVVEDLCWRAGTTFQYDDQDGAFAISVEQEPLEVVLARLLSGRSYLLRLRRDGAGASRVAALHVLGPDGVGRRAAEVPAPRFVVPFRLLEAAFRNQGSPEARASAVQGLLQSVRDDPRQRRAFLAADPTVMTVSLRNYPDAVSVLRQMYALAAGDAAAQAKLVTLMDALD
jgi:hypothetical protein